MRWIRSSSYIHRLAVALLSSALVTFVLTLVAVPSTESAPLSRADSRGALVEYVDESAGRADADWLAEIAGDSFSPAGPFVRNGVYLMRQSAEVILFVVEHLAMLCTLIGGIALLFAWALWPRKVSSDSEGSAGDVGSRSDDVDIDAEPDGILATGPADSELERAPIAHVEDDRLPTERGAVADSESTDRIEPV